MRPDGQATPGRALDGEPRTGPFDSLRPIEELSESTRTPVPDAYTRVSDRPDYYRQPSQVGQESQTLPSSVSWFAQQVLGGRTHTALSG